MCHFSHTLMAEYLGRLLSAQKRNTFLHKIVSYSSSSPMGKKRTYTLVKTKDLFIISLLVITLTILAVYLWGLGQHHTFFQNSIISTTIISIAFFLFITTGLYNGIKLKDNVGKITDKFTGVDAADIPSQLPTIEPIEVGEGIAGIILGILLWIGVAILLAVSLWIFSNVVVIVVMAFVAMLYWIFFRALRLVFKNSNKSKGDLMESVKWGLTYTLLYNFWIYGIFVLTTYLKH